MPETVESSSVETSSAESPELYAVNLSYPLADEPYPLFASETTEPVKTEESQSWASGSDFNKANEMGLEHYPILSAYEAVESGGPNFGDFSLYDNYTFHGITDDNMTSIAENYI